MPINKVLVNIQKDTAKVTIHHKYQGPVLPKSTVVKPVKYTGEKEKIHHRISSLFSTWMRVGPMN